MQNRNRLTDIENRLTIFKEEGVGGNEMGVLGLAGFKLLYIPWINNKVLQYSTGNYIQYLIINHNKKEYEKNIYI